MSNEVPTLVSKAKIDVMTTKKESRVISITISWNSISPPFYSWGFDNCNTAVTCGAQSLFLTKPSMYVLPFILEFLVFGRVTFLLIYR